MHYHPKCNENALNTHFIVIGALIFSSKSANRRFARPVLSSLYRPRISVRPCTLGTKTQVLFFSFPEHSPNLKALQGLTLYRHQQFDFYLVETERSVQP